MSRTRLTLATGVVLAVTACRKAAPEDSSTGDTRTAEASLAGSASARAEAGAEATPATAPKGVSLFWKWVSESSRHISQDPRAHFGDDMECYLGQEYQGDSDLGKCEAVVLRDFEATGASSYNATWYDAARAARLFMVSLTPEPVECGHLGGKSVGTRQLGSREVRDCEAQGLRVRIEQFDSPTPATRIMAYTPEYLARDQKFNQSLGE